MIPKKEFNFTVGRCVRKGNKGIIARASTQQQIEHHFRLFYLRMSRRITGRRRDYPLRCNVINPNDGWSSQRRRQPLPI